jgi:hypothetical protein
VRPEPAAAIPATVRVLAIADTDSYLKWSATTLDALPSLWESRQLLIQNPVMPSQGQTQAASSRPVEFVSHAALRRRIRLERPDVVLLACTGPVVAALTAQRVFEGRTRPVLVTGLPGISVPATCRAVTSRAACDLFLLHSKRELAEFAEIGARRAPRLIFGLATLPFLPAPTPEPLPHAELGPNLVFAAQAKVPMERGDREKILLALADAGSAVVKLRAWSEEQQTHRETWSYPEIMNDLVARRRLPADAVGFVGGSMHGALDRSRGLVTVSSTAALEAMAINQPTLIISDFGVSAEMINLVFEGSGCLGTLDDVRSGRLCQPDPQWMAANTSIRPKRTTGWNCSTLYAAMVSGCAAAGYRSVAFKPHPSAPAGQLAGLRDVAQDHGVRFAVAGERELAEAWFERGGVELVVGCFSTALMTARSLYGLPVARLGTEVMLERLSPYQNSNRIPVTLVDALVPDLSSLTPTRKECRYSGQADVNALMTAVGFAMQPVRLKARRLEAATFLAAHNESLSRHFKRRRLTLLDLPGKLPAASPRPKPTVWRRLKRRIHRARTALGRRLLGTHQPSLSPDTVAPRRA